MIISFRVFSVQNIKKANRLKTTSIKNIMKQKIFIAHIVAPFRSKKTGTKQESPMKIHL